jgi:hypothetical protein
VTIGRMAANGRSDFDFLIGSWTVQNRRLKRRLAGSDDWEEFGAKAVVRPVLGGLGNIDRISFDGPWSGHEGLTLRLFDPESEEWSLHWADNTSGRLFTRLVGSFRDGVGTFYAQEAFNGRQIFSRFIWSECTEQRCRWEQAFSADGGASWETNWTMTFTREAADSAF